MIVKAHFEGLNLWLNWAGTIWNSVSSPSVFQLMSIQIWLQMTKCFQEISIFMCCSLVVLLADATETIKSPHDPTCISSLWCVHGSYAQCSIVAFSLCYRSGVRIIRVLFSSGRWFEIQYFKQLNISMYDTKSFFVIWNTVCALVKATVAFLGKIKTLTW